MPLSGRITLITQDQKYGHLVGDDGINRLFERPEQSLMELLSEGDAVTFQHIHSEKGPAAMDVKLQPCPYCKEPIRTVAHLSVCPLRPPSMPPPQQAVIQSPARVGAHLITFVPFSSQPGRGRYHVYDLTNVQVGLFKAYDNAVRFALGQPVLTELEDAR